MAHTTKGDKIFFHIPSQLAPRLNMMDLKIVSTAALLASPAITLEHSLTELSIGIRIQANPGLFWDG